MAEEVVSFDLERSILDENEIRYTLWGNIYLLNITNSHKLIDFCEKNSIGILGIEGFIAHGQYRTPSMEHIADFSSAFESMPPEKFIIESARGAKKFLEYATDSQMMFEFELVIRQMTDGGILSR